MTGNASHSSNSGGVVVVQALTARLPLSTICTSQLARRRWSNVQLETGPSMNCQRERTPIRPQSELDSAMASVLSDVPSRKAVEYLVRYCHRMAIAYLLRKIRRGGLYMNLFGVSVDDLAMDSIAELFQRDEDGRFSVLRTYFGTPERDGTRPPLEIALRRLVFSKVRESLFRRYHEADPNLARIIRNMKDAAKGAPHIDVVRYHHTAWLVVRDEQGGDGTLGTPAPRLLAPPEVLEAFFTAQLVQHDRVHEMVYAYPDFVRAYPHYTNGYPLVAIAQILRRAYMRNGEAGEPQTSSAPAAFTFDVQNVIRTVTERLKSQKRASYVGRGKVQSTVYAAYFGAIRSILESQYVNDTEDQSYYATLTGYLPGVSEQDYMSNHRNIIEYLVKVARGNLLESVSVEA